MFADEHVPVTRVEQTGELLARRGRGLDDDRRRERRLRDLGRARRSAHAMLGKRLPKVGRRRQLAVAGLVIVGGGDDPDTTLVRVIREALQVGLDGFGIRHVELAGRIHEVVLGIDVPEYHA